MNTSRIDYQTFWIITNFAEVTDDLRPDDVHWLHSDEYSEEDVLRVDGIFEGNVGKNESKDDQEP